MRKSIYVATAMVALSMCGLTACAQSKSKSLSVEEALNNRYSERRYDASKDISEAQTLQILWAANGENKYGKRTAPSAMNAQDIDLYVCKKDGTWKYDVSKKKLVGVTKEDIRPYFVSYNDYANDAPFCILLVTDQSKFRAPREGDNTNRNMNFGLIDAGIVSENISLYCTSVGLGTVPCAPRMENEKIQKALGLTEKQVPVMYHPVGWPAAD